MIQIIEKNAFDVTNVLIVVLNVKCHSGTEEHWRHRKR